MVEGIARESDNIVSSSIVGELNTLILTADRFLIMQQNNFGYSIDPMFNDYKRRTSSLEELYCVISYYCNDARISSCCTKNLHGEFAT
jgi:hypothetical protein